MNLVFKISMFLVLLCGVFLIGSFNSYATDVWIARNSDGVDIYIMDDTIKYGVTSTGKWVSLSTKKVRNGKLLEVGNTYYSKYKTDMWRYHTNKMSNNSTVVIPKNNIFEYVMKTIGWGYLIRDRGYSSYYY